MKGDTSQLVGMMQRLMNTPEGRRAGGAHQPPGQAVGPDRLSPPHRRGKGGAALWGEMEDKLNAILNDPSAMGQIMALAQSLGGGAPRPQAPRRGRPPRGGADRRQGGGGARFGGERSAGPGGGRGPAGRPGEIDPGMIQMGMRLLREYQGGGRPNGGSAQRPAPLPEGEPPGQAGPGGADLPAGPGDPGPLPRHGEKGGGAMYNRYIPQNGTYTRVVEQDGPEEGAGVAPHPPGPERGEPGRTGPGAPQDLHRGSRGAPEEEAAGLPGSHGLWRPGGPALRGRRAR